MARIHNSHSSYKFTTQAISNLKKRMLLLIISSTLVVAAAFGFSFYFAFISTGSAIARQLPELSPVVSKLKNLLLFNTFGLITIILLSLYVLSRLATAKLFGGLGTVQKNMIIISEGRLPARKNVKTDGTFAGFESSFSIMLSKIREKESDELAQLEEYLKYLETEDHSKLKSSIKELINLKKNYLNTSRAGEEKQDPDIQNESDEVFVQPF
jgi:hypothetical protein